MTQRGEPLPLFSEILSRCSLGDLRNLIEVANEPLSEASLLTSIFPAQKDLIFGDEAVLFAHHFVLFHQLYQLQKIYQQEGKYLYVHFMRTVLLSLPSAGSCSFFVQEKLEFCRQRATDNFCEAHSEELALSGLAELSACYYYLDRANYERATREVVENMMSGMKEAIYKQADLQKAYEILGFSKQDSLRLIKLRYKELAREYHPDYYQDGGERFTEINNAYCLLMKVQGTISSLL